MLSPDYIDFRLWHYRTSGPAVRRSSLSAILGRAMGNALTAAEWLHGAPGIIIDRRRESGGSPRLAGALAAQFLAEPAVVGRATTREHNFDWIIQPADQPYERQMHVLIGALSFSRSDRFASAMQAIGRAVVVGDRSPGGVTGANIAQLPNGGLLMYPVIQFMTQDGVVPEGRGVIPDIVVELDRELLLQGIDSQLEEAIAAIKEQNGG